MKLRTVAAVLAGTVLVAGAITAGATVASSASAKAAASPVPGFVIDPLAGTATALNASTPVVTFGREQTLRIVVTVTPFAGGTPTGTVTVVATGSQSASTVCVVPLANGSVVCSLAAGRLAPDSYTLSGTYSGDWQYEGSTSPGKNLTVIG